jgi:hypothetical protein
MRDPNDQGESDQRHRDGGQYARPASLPRLGKVVDRGEDHDDDQDARDHALARQPGGGSRADQRQEQCGEQHAEPAGCERGAERHAAHCTSPASNGIT